MTEQAVKYPDIFEVVNGPEDGAQFMITRTPMDIGSDPGCGVFLRHDRNIKRFHARVTVVSEGYRIRRQQGRHVWINGRRVGRIRSRIVRSGGIVRVEETELTLYCAPEGLAGRSYGLPSESDIAWALRLLGKRCVRLLRAPSRFVVGVLSRHFWLVFGALAAAGAIAYFRPGFFGWLWWWMQYGAQWLQWQARFLIDLLPG